jgi:sec-independent protein translocase protein TatB
MLSVPHMIVILVVALVVFGPEKLPELARTLGKVMAEFRRHTGDLRSTFEGHLRDLEREGEARRIGGASQSAPVAAAAAPAPGTVPSNPPNAAAIASGAAEPPPEPFIPGMDPDLAAQDPYLAAAYKTPEPLPASEPVESPEPEKVSDGGARPA